MSIDEHIGKSIRLRRQIAGLSQADLGRAVGITGQQIYKYEVGASRISAGRLWSIADALDVPIALFFAGLVRENGAKVAPVEVELASNWRTG